MLDNTFAMHGSASSSFHLSRNYPIISAGGKNLGFDNGRYLKFGSGNEDNQAGAGIVTDAGWRGKIEAEELPLAKLFEERPNVLQGNTQLISNPLRLQKY